MSRTVEDDQKNTYRRLLKSYILAEEVVKENCPSIPLDLSERRAKLIFYSFSLDDINGTLEAIHEELMKYKKGEKHDK